jgi:hypothetical protein
LTAARPGALLRELTHDLLPPHLLGLDHARLTFRHARPDCRLTDIEGEVVAVILA